MTDENKESIGGASKTASDLHLHSKPRHVIMKVLTVFKEDVMESSKPRVPFEDARCSLGRRLSSWWTFPLLTSFRGT